MSDQNPAQLLYDLLAILRDPAKTQAILDAIKAREEAAHKAAAEAAEAEQQATEAVFASDKKVREANELAANVLAENEKMEARHRELVALDRDLKEREDDLATQRGRHAAVAKDVQAVLTEREKAVVSAEVQLAADRKKFDAERAALDENLALLRQVKPV